MDRPMGRPISTVGSYFDWVVLPNTMKTNRRHIKDTSYLTWVDTNMNGEVFEDTTRYNKTNQ